MAPAPPHGGLLGVVYVLGEPFVNGLSAAECCSRVTRRTNEYGSHATVEFNAVPMF